MRVAIHIILLFLVFTIQADINTKNIGDDKIGRKTLENILSGSGNSGDIVVMYRNDFKEVLQSIKRDLSVAFSNSHNKIKQFLNITRENSHKNLEELINISNSNLLTILKQEQLDTNLLTEINEIKKELNQTKFNCQQAMQTTVCLGNDSSELANFKSGIEDFMTNFPEQMKVQLKEIGNEINGVKNNLKKHFDRTKKPPRHCSEYFALGDKKSDTKQIYLYDNFPFNVKNVACEQITGGEFEGGWTTIQKRRNQTNRENFQRDWEEYVYGFGKPEGEHWIGLRAIHTLTNNQPMELKITLTDWEDRTEVVRYKKFSIESRQNNFKLHVGGFTGKISDAMKDGNGEEFSTTSDCAKERFGGWWYNYCSVANLNGNQDDAYEGKKGGITWIGFDSEKEYHPLKYVSMSIKPLQ